MKRLFLLLLVFTAAVGCNKTHFNDSILPPTVLASSSSSIRLFNAYGFDLDVTVNNIPLTSYSATNPNGTAQGLAIFPSGVWKEGTSFTIPGTLLDKNNQATISIAPRIAYIGVAPIPLPADTLLTSTPLQPVDFYVLSDGHYHALPRSAAVPARPMDFKIRVINLGSPADVNNLVGPVTLTYADGSLVDPKVTGVAPGQVSDYVELPYAAIEFKLFVNGNYTQQLTELPVRPNFDGEAHAPIYDQEARFSPTRTFKPGGVYNLFISGTEFQYENAYGIPYFEYCNAYRVITENSPPVNTTYARVQAFNAYPVDGAVTVALDGVPLGAPIAFGQHTDYSIEVQGAHTINVTDANGDQLARQSLTLYPYDNVTAWVYQQDSVPGVAFTAMDMNQVQTNFLFNCMNFCEGVPFLTFTNDVYPIDTAATNIPYGLPILYSSYYISNLTPYESAAGRPLESPPILLGALHAFSSNPGPPLELPGSYLDKVAPVQLTDFVANPQLYSTSPPPPEPGGYTLALIGTTTADTTSPYRPRAIILKHSK